MVARERGKKGSPSSRSWSPPSAQPHPNSWPMASRRRIRPDVLAAVHPAVICIGDRQFTL